MTNGISVLLLLAVLLSAPAAVRSADSERQKEQQAKRVIAAEEARQRSEERKAEAQKEELRRSKLSEADRQNEDAANRLRKLEEAKQFLQKARQEEVSRILEAAEKDERTLLEVQKKRASEGDAREPYKEKAELPEDAERRAKQASENEAVQQDLAQKSIQGLKDKAAEEFQVGMCFLNGTGVQTNKTEGIRYPKAAAKRGHVGAALKLKAIETEAAADQGDKEAAEKLKSLGK